LIPWFAAFDTSAQYPLLPNRARIASHEEDVMRSDGSADIANYIGEVATELRELARYSGLVTLSYILDLAILEAEQAAGPQTGGVPEDKQGALV
jgi:hypothetical protein